MKLLCTLPLAFTLFAATPVIAEPAETGESVTDEREFDLPGTDDSALSSNLDLEEVHLVGNPLKKLAANWPEDLVIAPVPAYSPQLGWSLTLGGGYFIQTGNKDAEHAPSILGGFVMGAENGSYAYGAGGNLHLLDDRFRLKFGAAYADIRYQFYGVGNGQNDTGIHVDLLQNGPFYFATGSWRAWKKLYLGLGYLKADIDTRLRFVITDQPFFDPTLSLKIAAINIPVEIDSRDHEQFPRNGWLIQAKGKLYRESVGSDFDAESFELTVNRYLPIRDLDVLALRVVAKATSEEIPFFLKSSFGGGTDLRGYPAGRFRDRMMYAMQAEYRWHLKDRWILTGFAGLGEVAESFSKFGRNFLPAGGIGARYVLSEKHRVSLSADLAVGNDGVEFYFGVGEAF